MKSCITLVVLFIITFPVSSQEDERFVNSIFKDCVNEDCDSFLLITLKEKITITDYIEIELKKVLPQKAIKEICISSNDINKKWEWDTTKLNFVIPINNNAKHDKERELIDDVNNAREAFLITYGLDSIGDYNVFDSLENVIVQSGVNIYDFSKIPPCYRQMYAFSRPLFSKKHDFAMISFTNHKWISNASGFIAVYAYKKGKWVRIAEINHWVS